MGVDGSDPAQRAARRAFGLATRLGDSVTLLHVLPPPPVISEPAVVLNVADLEKHVYEAGKLLLEKLAAAKPPVGRALTMAAEPLACCWFWFTPAIC